MPGEVDYVNIYQPSTVEQIVNYIHTISNALPENRNPKRPVCIYTLDSVVALITNEIDDNLDANKMSMHARAYATYLPVINSDLVRSGSSLIYMNQLRQRPGNAYGCLQGDTLIGFVDGRCYPIREIVENKIEGEVWSHTDGKIHPAKITNWYDNGTSTPKDWIHIWTEGPGNEVYNIIVTKNHKVLKSNGEWVEAQHLVKDDELVTKYQKTFEEGSKGLSYASLPVKVTKIKEGLGHRYNRKYDIEVEGTHNYVAGHSRGGLVVHNSPIYEPAGDALKFFSSIRLMLSGTKPKIDEDDHPFLTKEMIPGVVVKEGGVWEEPHMNSQGNVVGIDRYVYTGVKTVKNKVFTPFQKCWVRIQFEENGSTGHGLDPVFDVFTFLLEEGYMAIKKEGRKNIKGCYVARKCDRFDPVKELDMPSTFDYFEFKAWVETKPDLVATLREKLLVSGIVYTKEELDTFKNIQLENEEELEAMADCDTMEEAEEVEETVEKKKRGRKPKSS